VVEPSHTTSNERVFKPTGEPLYGGKGKRSGLTSNNRDIALGGVCIDVEDISQLDKHNDNQVSIGNKFKSLQQPCLQVTKSLARGEDKTIMRRENKLRRQELRAEQPLISPWTHYEGEAPSICPTDHTACPPHQNSMCPVGCALKHPAAKVLKEWATFGCPTRTGKPWTKAEMWEAVARGPHCLALSPEAIAHFKAEATEKVRTKQAQLVQWEDIKDNPPKELKISPIAAIPHKSKDFCSILDLSFRLRLKNGGVLVSVNNTTEKTAPAGAIDQIGECLSRIIHAFAKTDEDAKIFMAKWDIKDRFWRMDCTTGEEWNFAYVLPQEDGMPTTLVVPTSLQMGWVKSPPYFCAATETSRDVATEYAETKLNSLTPHKFEKFIVGAPEYQALPEAGINPIGFAYMVEVYVDDFMCLRSSFAT
jgi:hypothetical protein